MAGHEENSMAGSFVEVTLNSCSSKPDLWKIKTNAEVSDNDDAVFSSAAGGFLYEKQSKLTKSRYVTWRVTDNTLQLEEFSLDYNLFNNKLSISIDNEVLLPNVYIHEEENNISICFATTTSVHRISLLHPNHEKYGYIVPSGMNISLPSIFHQASSKGKHDQVELEISCMDFDVTVTSNNVYFAMKTVNKTLLVVPLYQQNEESSVELKDSGIMQRLWTGLVPSFVRGDSSMMDVCSVLIHSFRDEEIFAFTLCKDFKIRVWNIKTKTCVSVKDLVSLIPDNLDNQEDIGSLSLRKVHGDTSQQLTIAAHCSLSYSSQFIVFEVFKEPNNVVMMHVSNFFSDFNSIDDFYITPQYLWALWSTCDGEYSLSYAPIEGGKDFERGWHLAHLKKSEDKDLYISVFQDAKEVFLEKIFSPQIYNKTTIIKALQVFTSNIGSGSELLPGLDANRNMVKEFLIRILDLEIEMTLLSSDIEISKYQELQNQCWSKFYAIFQQCLQSQEKPIGIFADSSNTNVLLLRQEMNGYFYYHDWIDHIWISDLSLCEAVSRYVENELEPDDESICEDIITIIKSCKALSKQFPIEVIQGIKSDLDRNEDVKKFLSSMASVLVTNSSEFEQLVGDPLERGDFLCQIEAPLKSIREPQKALEIILTALKCVDFQSSVNLDQSENESTNVQFLCSSLGIELVSDLIHVTSYHRMNLCRDLFILMTLMHEMRCKLNLNGPEGKEFNILTADVCYELLRAFHCIYWSSTQPFEKVEENLLETNLTNLAALNITEKSPSSNTARKVGSDNENYIASYLQTYLRDFGLQNALNYLTESNLNDLKPGDYSSAEMLKLILKVSMNDIWILNDKSSNFPEYLASHGQYSALNSFMHLCDGWCSVNEGTKDFFLGQSFLGTNQPKKAFKYFTCAARGIGQMEPLLLKLVEYEDIEDFDSCRKQLLLQYFIKVMRIFEQFDYPTYVIAMATTALTVAAPIHESMPMLWTIIFKYNLELEHYKDAYSAIIHNNDKQRRYDCLRHFVVTLCEDEKFQELCSYSYVGLEEEVVSILETRARTIDITVNKYYDLLYSYHILKNDYRKASTAMYEQACRLSTEMHGLKSLQKQAKCYLAAITALSLVDKIYAWIVKPHDKTQSLQMKHQDEKPREICHSPKRKEDGEEVYYSKTLKSKKSKIVIMEIADLEKEYSLILARLKLIQYGKTDSVALGPQTSPHEIIGLLCQQGLFDMAFTIAEKFKIPLENVFASLAAKCASMSFRNISDYDDDWKWLTFNEINSSQLVNPKSALQHSFHLLQNYLKKYHTTTSSVLYKTVTSKLLSLGCSLPAWLVLDYQRCNPSELLQLYISYDMIEEAFNLSMKYIDGVLGAGKEQLGIQTALHATTPAVWLPYTYFDQLIAALKANSRNSDDVIDMLQMFQDKLEIYFQQQETVSCDKLDYLYKVSNRIH